MTGPITACAILVLVLFLWFLALAKADDNGEAVWRVWYRYPEGSLYHSRLLLPYRDAKARFDIFKDAIQLERVTIVTTRDVPWTPSS